MLIQPYSINMFLCFKGWKRMLWLRFWSQEKQFWDSCIPTFSWEIGDTTTNVYGLSEANAIGRTGINDDKWLAPSLKGFTQCGLLVGNPLLRRGLKLEDFRTEIPLVGWQMERKLIMTSIHQAHHWMISAHSWMELQLQAPNWRFPQIGVPQIIHWNRIFHCFKPTILGIPPFRETPKWPPETLMAPICALGNPILHAQGLNVHGKSRENLMRIYSLNIRFISELQWVLFTKGIIKLE